MSEIPTLPLLAFAGDSCGHLHTAHEFLLRAGDDVKIEQHSIPRGPEGVYSDLVEEVAVAGREVVWCSSAGSVRVCLNAPAGVKQATPFLFESRWNVRSQADGVHCESDQRSWLALCVLHNEGLCIAGADGTTIHVALPHAVKEMSWANGALVLHPEQETHLPLSLSCPLEMLAEVNSTAVPRRVLVTQDLKGQALYCHLLNGGLRAYREPVHALPMKQMRDDTPVPPPLEPAPISFRGEAVFEIAEVVDAAVVEIFRSSEGPCSRKDLVVLHDDGRVIVYVDAHPVCRIAPGSDRVFSKLRCCGRFLALEDEATVVQGTICTSPFPRTAAVAELIGVLGTDLRAYGNAYPVPSDVIVRCLRACTAANEGDEWDSVGSVLRTACTGELSEGLEGTDTDVDEGPGGRDPWEELLHSGLLNGVDSDLFGLEDIFLPRTTLPSRASSHTKTECCESIMTRLHVWYETLKLWCDRERDATRVGLLLCEISNLVGFSLLQHRYIRDGVDDRDWQPLSGAASEFELVLSAADVFTVSGGTDLGELPWRSVLHASPLRESRGVLEALAAAGVENRLVVEALANAGVTKTKLQSLRYGIACRLREAMQSINPPGSWGEAEYALVERYDLSLDFRVREALLRANDARVPTAVAAGGGAATGGDLAGQRSSHKLLPTRNIESLLFPDDLRARTAEALLDSSQVITIKAGDITGISEHELVELRQAQLLQNALFSLSKPLGRGMMQAHSRAISDAELVGVPQLVWKKGIVEGGLQGGNVSLDDGAVDSKLSNWSQFHNGFAAALSVNMSDEELARPVTPAWLAHQQRNQSFSQHGGFLMGMGAQGGMRVVDSAFLVEMLSKSSHEVMSVGLVLGCAASRIGQMDKQVCKLLSVHIPALHPPSSLDLELPAAVQAAALVGMGLLHQGTQHRLMSATMLSEIARGAEECSSSLFHRPSFVLAAGFALGLIGLGCGGNAPGLADLRIKDRLVEFMGSAAPEPGGFNPLLRRGPRKVECSVVVHGVDGNVSEITAPAALCAFALLYLKTSDSVVASLTAVPRELEAIQESKPIVLTLRALCTALIQWDDIGSGPTWLANGIPQALWKAIDQLGAGTSKLSEVSSLDDLRSIASSVACGEATAAQALANHPAALAIRRGATVQAYHAIMAGLMLAQGMRFAGTQNKDIAYAFLDQCELLKQVVSRSRATDQCTRYHHRNCCNIALLSAALVMAGSGDERVLRSARTMQLLTLHRKQGNETFPTHVCMSMVIGLLFLGGGTESLGTTNECVAAMLMACYPSFPSEKDYELYHLPALRAMWALAAQHRCLTCLDSETNEPCKVDIEVFLTAEGAKHHFGDFGGDRRIRLTTPAILPEFRFIDTIEFDSSKHCQRTLEVLKNPRHLQLLQQGGIIFVQRRQRRTIPRQRTMEVNGAEVYVVHCAQADYAVVPGILSGRDRSQRWDRLASLLLGGNRTLPGAIGGPLADAMHQGDEGKLPILLWLLRVAQGRYSSKSKFGAVIDMRDLHGLALYCPHVEDTGAYIEPSALQFALAACEQSFECDSVDIDSDALKAYAAGELKRVATSLSLLRSLAYWAIPPCSTGK